jgi:hypothetical protein
MSDTVIIAGIIAVTIIVVVIALRQVLQKFKVDASVGGVGAEFTSSGRAPDPKLAVRSNWQIGGDNRIAAASSEGIIEKNKQLGRGSSIETGTAAAASDPVKDPPSKQ